MADSAPLLPESWGSIDEVLAGPLTDIVSDNTWFAVIVCWLTLPLGLLLGIIGGVCECFTRVLAWSGCLSAYKSVINGRPWYFSFSWWSYMFSLIVALAKSKGCRLRLFMWENGAFGGKEHWWHGEGVWCKSWALCDEIMRSVQSRTTAFGCQMAPCPDVFPPGILIFLPCGGQDSEWWSIRNLLHSYFLNMGLPEYNARIADLGAKLQENWPDVKLVDMDAPALVQQMVSKCIFYCVLGTWVTDDEAKTLTGWRSLAPLFVFPRIGQRLLFNLGVKKIKKLRKDTVAIVEKYDLQEIFIRMNSELPPQYQRTPAVKLCDEIMYVFGFAGIGGTSACTETVSAFLQLKLPKECAKETIDFSNYESTAAMVERYKADPEAYIKESGRVNPPVTSATSVLTEDTTVEMVGEEVTLPKGMLRQYTLSMANRDAGVFEQPDVFNPQRPNLSKAFTWNGAFGMTNEEDYLRICPGRNLSVSVCKAIIDRALVSFE